MKLKESMMKSLNLSPPVARVTPGKEKRRLKLHELEIGDEFILPVYDKRCALVTKRVSFSICSTGDRVRYGGSWYIVLNHGRENVLLPLVPNKPFSVKTGTNHGTFP